MADAMSYEEAQRVIREKEEELAREKARLEFDQRVERAKLETNATAQECIKESEKQVAAAEKFYEGFPDDWSLNISTRDTHKSASMYNPYKIGEKGDPVYEEVYRKNFTLRTAVIGKGSFTVKIDRHITYSGDSFYGNKKDHGYKMFLSGRGVEWNYEQRAIARPSTILKKVREIEQAEAAREKTRGSKKEHSERLLKYYQELYPDAEISLHSKWIHPQYSKVGSSEPIISIKFPNGVSVEIRVYSDGSQSRHSSSIPRMDSMETYLDAMMSIRVPKKEE